MIESVLVIQKRIIKVITFNEMTVHSQYWYPKGVTCLLKEGTQLNMEQDQFTFLALASGIHSPLP